MTPLTQTGRLHLDQLFWLRCLAIAGQFVTIAVVQAFLHVHLPLTPMLAVIGLEIAFNAWTWRRVSQRGRRETDGELFGQLFVDLLALSALLFLSGGTTNPFVSLYLPSLAIAAAVLPLRLALWLALFAVICYLLLGVYAWPLRMDDPKRLFDDFQMGLWVDFMVSVGLIAWFVSRMSQALRMRDAALADAHQRLLRDERVVALGAQAASVAHEIGTPLASVLLLSEELRLAALDNPHLAPFGPDLQLLEQQVGLCQSALARLRVRAETGSRQSVDVWLPGFVEQWRVRHPHVSMEIVGLMPSRAVLGDTVAAGQILTILLDNAARASRDFVTLEARVTKTAAGDLSTAGAGENIEFLVCDRGPGVPDALRDALGLVPVESTQGGQGVGLYLAYATAAQLAGSIALRDAPERGTLAILSLPNQADAA